MVDFYYLNQHIHLFFYDCNKIRFYWYSFRWISSRNMLQFFLSSSSHNFLFLYSLNIAAITRRKVKYCIFSWTLLMLHSLLVCMYMSAMLSVWIKWAWIKAAKWNTNESCHVYYIHRILYYVFFNDCMLHTHRSYKKM